MSTVFAGGNFRRFLAVGGLVNSGRWVEMVLLGWAVAELTDSVWLVALAGFCRNVPMLLVGGAVGEAADRFGRRRLALVAEALAAAVCLTMGTLLLAGQRSYLALALAATGLGVSYAIEYPMRRAMVADLVDRPLLMRAVSLDILTYNVTRVVAPLFGGALLKAFEPAVGYLSLAAIYGVAMVLLAGVRFPPLERAATEARVSAREGLGALLNTPAILGIMGVTITMNVLVFPHQNLLPIFARDVLHVDALGLGWLTAAAGVGSVIGSAMLARAPALPQGRTFLLSSLTTAILVLLFAVSGNVWIASLALVGGGLTQSGFSTMQSATLLHAAPAALRGRASGWLAVCIGTGPFGVIAIGAAAAELGAPTAVALAAAAACGVVVLQAILFPALRLYRWRET